MILCFTKARYNPIFPLLMTLLAATPVWLTETETFPTLHLFGSRNCQSRFSGENEWRWSRRLQETRVLEASFL